MKKNRPLTIIAFSLLFINLLGFRVDAQVKLSNLSSANIAELSDDQLKALLTEAKSSGMSAAQFIETARAKGATASQISNLQQRLAIIEANSNVLANDTTVKPRKYLPPQKQEGSRIEIDGLKIWGSDLFNGGNYSFTPNLRIATPVNYILGPDDQLIVNVFGKSVVNWKLLISPEGNINIPGVGIVNVTGKSIEQATALIKGKLLASNYAIGNGTFVQVTLGDIRSINVIITGEVVKPGTYTLPSLATVFNALYESGGPNINGSFRQIEIIRNSRLLRRFDLYDFLLKGDQKNNIGLKDQDIIRIPTYRVRVEVSGEVKRPALYEVAPGESLQDIINYSGGFSDLAYVEKIKVLQIKDQQRSITDVLEPDYKNYIPLRGDKFFVDKILETFKNRIVINGAVIRPGDYELENGLTVSGLIAKASGLRPDAFSSRGTITRLKLDNSAEIISFNVQDIINKKIADIKLQREDLVTISSILDLRDAYNLSINGEVRHPGTYGYADNLSVEDLILKAGGLTEGASSKRIEVSRRVDNSNPSGLNGNIAEVFSISVDGGLNLKNVNFILKPFDMVSVYTMPGYERPKVVKLEGEVVYPGYYTVKVKNERISDVVARAGGLTAAAFLDGGTLRRANSAALGFDKNKVDTTALQQEREARLKNLSRSANDSASIQNTQLRNNYVGIDLKSILNKPGSKTDLILEDGDVLRVPKEQQIVKVSGEVLYPSSIIFNNRKSFGSYVINAGGFSDNALRRKSYVVYPNGTVKGTRKFLFFNMYPDVKPGSEIFVPKKLPRKGVSTQEVIGITTGIATLGAIILGVINLTK